MKLSQRLQDERAFVERSLGDSVICRECGATLKTFADMCTAGLQEACPGFLAIELVKDAFRLGSGQGSTGSGGEK